MAAIEVVGEWQLRVSNGRAGHSPDTSEYPGYLTTLVHRASRQRWASYGPMRCNKNLRVIPFASSQS
jgi:hypothetical protein